MPKFFKAILSLVLLVGLSLKLSFLSLAVEESKPIFFYGQGCPHCAKVEQFFNQHHLRDKVVWREVYHHPDNAKEFNQIAAKLNIPLNQRGVPFLYFPGTNQYLLGDEPIIQHFQTQLDTPSPPSQVKVNSSQAKPLTLMAVIGAALVDAINPCALAVLLILMATAIASGRQKRALFSGLAFTLAVFLSYLAMGLGIYHALATAALANSFYRLVGYLALALALLNLKDFFWYGKVFLTEVPRSWRPKMKSLLQSVTGPGGAFVIGGLVSLFLLPCTSGPYLVILGMLSQKTTFTTAWRLLVLYNLIFISPMILLTFATYFGLNLKKTEQFRHSHLRLLHLLAAVLLAGLALFILIR